MSICISDLILMSDVDGTLLGRDEVVPQRNIDALSRFTANGGSFALATGRSLPFTRKLCNMLPVNFPCVTFNGGMLYDPYTDCALSETFLPDAAQDYLCELMQAFPQIEVLVVNKDDYFDVSIEQDMTRRSRSLRGWHKGRVSTVPQLRGSKWYKVLFVASPEDMRQLDHHTAHNPLKGVRFVRTNAQMVELLPEGVSKGNALQQLMRMRGFDAAQLVAIGDFYNDVEMLQLAGISATVAGAPQTIKDIAGLVVGRCEDGALADLIEYLETTYLC